MMKNLLFALIQMLLLASCKHDGGDLSYQTISIDESIANRKEEKLFTLLDSLTTGITFTNVIHESERINVILYPYLYNGGGIAAGDINNDGLIDLYFSGGMVFHKLYLNLGNFKFKDITQTAGVDGGMGFKTGVTMVDINNDGFLDIYVCKSIVEDPQLRRNLLYINNGDLTFTERAAAYGLDDASHSSQAYFFDMDGDGDLDLYLVNHPSNQEEANNLAVEYNDKGEIEILKPRDYAYISDRLYENTGSFFKDITQKAGVENHAFGLSAVIGDFNNDQRPDIYVCNDYIKPDYLYINNGNKTFTESFSSYFRHSSISSMGSDFADINNDGFQDIITLDMLPRDHYRQNMLMMIQNYDKFEQMEGLGLKAQYVQNALQLNNGNGTFSDIGFMSNTANTDWSWSALFGDYDNDGWKDLFVSNGYKRDLTNQDYARYAADSLRKEFASRTINMMDWIGSIPSFKIKSYLFRNNGNLHFSDVSDIWNSGTPAFSNGAAYADLDNDGYLDIVVNNIDEPAFVLRNEGKASRANNFVRFTLEDKERKTAYGTRIRIYSGDGKFQEQLYYPTRGFYSSVEPIIHFGIGKETSIASVEIIWPDGRVQQLKAPGINKVHHVVKTPSSLEYKAPMVRQVFFEDVSSALPLEAVHKENKYIDFKREPLLHRKHSEEGPATAVGDVNGDGLDDIYLGGALGYAGKLFLQKRGGGFVYSQQGDFESDSLFEDVDALFFDANSDGFNDLIVVSGGNERPASSEFYQSRLYLNDGKGLFTRSIDGLPQQQVSHGCVAVADLDGDGDMDLFLGGRITPGKYPVPPASSLFRNEKGKFSNVTAAWSDGLANAGMVTDAAFIDLDQNNTLELVLTGEWMPVTIFKKVDNIYINATADFGLTDFTGWWSTLEIADVNLDGFPDIIAGNLGLNSYIQVSKDRPATMYFKDFDSNGSIDPVLCFYNGDQSYPLHYRDRMQDQMIFLKKKFTRYHLYAKATLEDIFTAEQLKDAQRMTANTLSHTLFINQHGQKFTAQPLPRYTQISTLQSIKAIDINRDGLTDLVVGGNYYGTDAQFARYDASVGAILIGDGTGQFKIVSPADSGFSIPGNVRDILPVKTASGLDLFVSRCNENSSLFKIK